MKAGVAAQLHLIKEVEIRHVAAPRGAEQHRLELVSPEDLLRDVRGATLARGCGGLHGGVEGDQQLEVPPAQVFRVQTCQRAALIQDVVEGEREDEERAVAAGVHVKIHRALVDQGLLTFLCNVGVEELPCYLALDQEALPHVGHPHHQTQLPLAATDHRHLAELDGLRSLLGPSQFGEEGAGDEDLSEAGDDELCHQSEDGQRTLLRDVAKTVADGGLGLQGEEEGSSERPYVHHAGRVGGIRTRLEVSVAHADEVEDDPKDEPSHDKGGGEKSQFVAPLHVHHSGPDVMQVQLDHAFHVVDSHVVVAVFGHDPPLSRGPDHDVLGRLNREVVLKMDQNCKKKQTKTENAGLTIYILM